MTTENYVYKKEVDLPLLHEGLTLSFDNQVVFYDANNQSIVCPNHYNIIHDTNPIFDRRRLIYIYKNGLEQRLVLNQHL